MEAPAALTVQAAGRLLRSGDLRCEDLTRGALERAAEADSEVGIFLDVYADSALRRARELDRELQSGVDRGLLHGIPMGIKDIIACREGATSAQSLVFDRSWRAGSDAPVVARLREAGATIVGKTTTMEFACGMPDASKPFPVPRNPWDTRAWAGGSSSGSASGVAVGAFLGALGTDTAGSIRIPAAFCGVSGVKPTYSVVPRSGVVPLAYSLDHVGPLARSVWDCAAILRAIAGPHATDLGGNGERLDDQRVLDTLAGTPSLAGMRIGIVNGVDHLPDGASSGLSAAFANAVSVLAELGATVDEVSLPMYAEGKAANLVIAVSEALSYHRTWLGRRWDDYSQDTRAMLALGSFVTGADYVQAQRVRRRLREEVAVLFERVDAVVSPTVSVTAPAVQDLGTVALLDHLNTSYWNVAGNPVASIPVGFDDHGLPVGMQVAAPAFRDDQCLAVGVAFQEATTWHLQLPTPTATEGEDPRDASRPVPAAEPDPADGEPAREVGVLLRRSELHVGPRETAGLVPGAELVRALVAQLHDLDGIRETEPAVVLDLASRGTLARRSRPAARGGQE